MKYFIPASVELFNNLHQYSELTDESKFGVVAKKICNLLDRCIEIGVSEYDGTTPWWATLNNLTLLYRLFLLAGEAEKERDANKIYGLSLIELASNSFGYSLIILADHLDVKIDIKQPLRIL